MYHCRQTAWSTLVSPKSIRFTITVFFFVKWVAAERSLCAAVNATTIIMIYITVNLLLWLEKGRRDATIATTTTDDSDDDPT